MARKAAKIDVTINPATFNDAATTQRLSPATFTLDPRTPADVGVTQDAATQRLMVSQVAKLAFRFPVDGAGNPIFKPIDAMFVQTAVTPGQPTDDDGKRNIISRVRNNRNWLVVLNALNEGDPVNPTKWKYFIAVLEVGTGKIGIIDPEISNVDQD
jgi:hypothetical protein